MLGKLMHLRKRINLRVWVRVSVVFQCAFLKSYFKEVSVRTVSLAIGMKKLLQKENNWPPWFYTSVCWSKEKSIDSRFTQGTIYNNSSKLDWASTDLFCFWPEKQGMESMIFFNKRSMIAKRYADMMSCISILLTPSNFWLAFLKALFCGFYYRQVWNKLPPPGLPRPSIFEHVSLL